MAALNTRTDAVIPTVAVVGDTGVGKSTLINQVIERQAAPTGIGAPVTAAPRHYLNASRTLGLWDLPGAEHGKEESSLRRLKADLDWIRDHNPHRAIDVAWFCWSASSFRVTTGQRAMIDLLTARGVPVMGVLTKCHLNADGFAEQQRAFRDWILEHDPGLFNKTLYLTSAVADSDFGMHAGGVEGLVAATLRVARLDATPWQERLRRRARLLGR